MATECPYHAVDDSARVVRCWHRDDRMAVQFSSADFGMTIIGYFEDRLIHDGTFSAWNSGAAPSHVVDDVWGHLIEASRACEDESPRMRLAMAEEILRRLRTFR